MTKMLVYIEDQIALFLLILALAALATVLLLLYLRQKRLTYAAQEAARGERDFYNDFFEFGTDVYLLLSKDDLHVRYMSPNFERLTGLEQELLRTDVTVLTEWMEKKDARRIRHLLKEWDHAEPFDTEYSYHDRNTGEARRVRLWVYDNAGDEDYLVKISDITDTYRTLVQLTKKLASAEEASQAKTDFLSSMSHEIRTPMNGIIGTLSLAKMHVEDHAAELEYLARMEKLSQFLLTLINNILDISRIESGKMQLEQAKIDLFGMADRLNVMFKNTAEEKGLHWEVQMQDFDVRYVIGDELRLTQVIINFISNANKFTPSGGSVTVTFRQMSKIEGNLHLMIRVRDTGKGIKESFLKNIFRPFEQEDASTAHNYGGSGLGMAIADSIIRLMGGQILVESELGKGSEFIVYVKLPIAEGDQTLPDAAASAGAAEDETARRARIEAFTLEGLHILLAEDNDINAEIAIELLEMEGAVMERAVDGQEALEKFLASEPGAYDAILMDIQMPRLDGWEATKEIRASGKADADIPIFAMSANAFVEDKRHSLEVGMDGHISKPVDFNEVRELLAERLCGEKSSL